MNKQAKPRLSVCIPVYNLERYMEQCARSLFESTLEDIEFLFLDDGSPDNSMKILENVIKDYPHRQHQIRLLRHEKNKGHVETLKDLLTNATGEYIITCDSDDWVEPDMYEKMYLKAKETQALIVACDHYKEVGKGRRKIIHHSLGSKSEDLIKIWLTPNHPAYSWVTMAHHSIIEKLEYVPCGSAEDCVRVCQMLHYAGSNYAYIPEPLYHYRVEGQGFSSQRDVRSRIKTHCIAYGWITNFLHKEYGLYYDKEFNMQKLYSKFYWCKNGIIPEFYDIWPEVNQLRLILELPVAIERKIVLLLACYRQGWLLNVAIKIHNFCKG